MGLRLHLVLSIVHSCTAGVVYTLGTFFKVLYMYLGARHVDVQIVMLAEWSKAQCACPE